MEERSIEEMVGTEREDDGQRDEREDSERAVEEDCVMSQGRVEEEETLERQESESEETGTAGSKRARAAPTFSDEHKVQIVEFVKDLPQLYAKEPVHYVDKGKKDAPRDKIGKEIGRTGPDVHRWFQTQSTRYSMLTADLRKSDSSTSKKFFQFFYGYIMRKGSTETVWFSCSSANVRFPDESRGSGTATDV